jgi:hypothetical protein
MAQNISDVTPPEFSLAAIDDSPEEDIKASVSFVRTDLDQIEVNAINKANSALYLATISSPFSDFFEALKEYWTLLEEIDSIVARSPAGMVIPRLPEISRRVAAVLSHFRSSLDQSDRRICDEFGEESPERDAFARQTRREYDRHVEYRLAYNLRNEVQHRQSLISGKSSSFRGADGNRDYSIEISISEDVLTSAMQPGSKWQAPVRRELNALARPVLVSDLLAQLELCCERIYAAIIISQEAKIRAAGQLVSNLHDEVKAKRPDGLPILASYPPGEFSQDRPRWNLSITPVRFDLIPVFEGNLTAGRALLSHVGDL